MNKEKDIICIPTSFIIGIFRYALGRRTYVVSRTIELIKKKINKLDERYKDIMIREIDKANEYNEYNDLGREYEKDQWLDLKKFLQEKF